MGDCGVKIKEGQIWYYPKEDLIFLITAKITGREISWFIFSGITTINVTEDSIFECDLIGDL